MEPILSHFYGVCERHAHGLTAEPLNVISNLGFLYVAVVIYRFYHKHEDVMGRWIWDIHAMTFLTFIIGINSIIFHAYPNATTELMDTIPIVMFIMIYFTSVLFRIGRTNVFQAVICLVAFVGFSHVLVHQFPRALNDSIGYLSSMIALIIILSISSTMMSNVRDRLGEIGTCMALGDSRRTVLRRFLVEGAVLGFFGGVAGTAMSGAQLLFWVAIVLFVVSVVAGLIRRA